MIDSASENGVRALLKAPELKSTGGYVIKQLRIPAEIYLQHADAIDSMQTDAGCDLEPDSKPEPLEKLLTYREAGALLGCHERTIYNLVQRGDLPSIKVGSQGKRIAPDDLRAYIRRARG